MFIDDILDLQYVINCFKSLTHKRFRRPSKMFTAVVGRPSPNETNSQRKLPGSGGGQGQLCSMPEADTLSAAVILASLASPHFVANSPGTRVHRRGPQPRRARLRMAPWTAAGSRSPVLAGRP